ncbi:hypothetical protein ABR737_01070 [Streptomyces sp. Edi2]|uniref:hypothetical protein n=1 Tax=Streptomyces sp. Edi2 TaxID=3162528 RepID=UPI0033065CE8
MISKELMSLSDMAQELGVASEAVQGWHRSAPDDPERSSTPLSALEAVAAAMQIAVPEAESKEPQYPRDVFVAYCKAVGYMDEVGNQAVGFMDDAGNVVPPEQIDHVKVGRYLPVSPTIEPGPEQRFRYYVNHVSEFTGLPIETVQRYARCERTELSFPAPDGLDEAGRPFWFLQTFSMSLSDMAEELGVLRQTVQKWHRAPKAGRARPTTPESALKAVAAAMKMAVPEADREQPRYPRAVFVAYCKAVGYMDEDENLVPELQARIQQKKRGRWRPVHPTIEPGPQGRRRYYINHASEVTGLSENSLRVWATPGVQESGERSFPAPDGLDEMDRPYWFLETLGGYKTRRKRSERMLPAEPKNADDAGGSAEGASSDDA